MMTVALALAERGEVAVEVDEAQRLLEARHGLWLLDNVMEVTVQTDIAGPKKGGGYGTRGEDREKIQIEYEVSAPRRRNG